MGTMGTDEQVKQEALVLVHAFLRAQALDKAAKALTKGARKQLASKVDVSEESKTRTGKEIELLVKGLMEVKASEAETSKAGAAPQAKGTESLAAPDKGKKDKKSKKEKKEKKAKAAEATEAPAAAPEPVAAPAPVAEPVAAPAAAPTTNGSSNKRAASSSDSESEAEPVAKKARVEEPAPSSSSEEEAATPTTKADELERQQKKRASRQPGERFQRIKADDVAYHDQRLADNSFAGRQGEENDYGARASRDLLVTRGKGFTKEKNKKKRGSYKGGEITLKSHSIKFDP